ncbi:MAG: LuxR C-terminal-related transcriptional regulator [Actinobacteria bacterium]|nr:LuxR C-terminal-related transcriptional regulator [Actinomycetota bacterium]MCL5447230.1 LuxR C-terminal-related transcriptional regulator [Actinomycetota bacterium]
MVGKDRFLGASASLGTGPDLLEREAALEAVAEILRRGRAGEGGVLFLIGEAGLGKTTLFADACARATDFTIRAAGCSEAESVLPFGLLTRLFGGLGVFAGGRDGIGSGEARARHYVDLLDWLRERAPKPLLVAIDDLHWADTDSAELLALICRRIGGIPVAVVAAARPWPDLAYGQARLLAVEGHATIERLAPLSDGAGRALLAKHLGNDVPDDLATRALGVCAGNPLLLGELASTWRRSEGSSIAATKSARALAERIYLARFAGVGTSALHFARGASVLGTRFSTSVVAGLVGQSEAVSLAALDALCRAGLVRGTPRDDAEFVHPLFREALYEDMPEPVRRAMHTQAFRVLHARGAPAAASHAVAAGMRGDPEAIGALAEAGRVSVAAGALATAVEHLKSAVGMAEGSAPLGLQIELAQAELAIGHATEAEEVLRAVLDTGVATREPLSGPERVAVLRLLAQVLLATVSLAGAKKCSEEASSIALEFDPVLACDTLLDYTFFGWLFEGPRRARATTQRVLSMIDKYGIVDERLHLSALTADAYLAYLQGDAYGIDAVAEAAGVALEAEAANDPTPWFWDVRFGYSLLAKLAERFEEEAAAHASIASRAMSQGAMLTYEGYAVNHADTLWRVGRIEEAYGLLRSATEMIEIARAVGTHASVGMAHLCQELGRDEESAMWLERVDAAATVMGDPPYLRLWLLLVTCRDHLQAGRITEAVAAAECAGSLAGESGILEPCVVPWHAAAIEAYASARKLDRLEGLLDSLEERCEPLECRTPRAVAAAGRATLAWRLGKLDDAERLYEEALGHHCGVGMPLAEAETLVAYGRFLRLTDRAVPAKGVLRRALDLAEPAGAVRIQRIAKQELAAAGGRRRKSASRVVLSPQEKRVAALAAGGLTNKQLAERLFISPKTVDHHLSSVYAKLGIGSRRELMLTWRDDLVEECHPSAGAS